MKIYRELPITRIDGASAERTGHPVVEEVPISILVNGRQLTLAMMSPVQLEEFALGHLFTEGIIRGPASIESIQVEKQTIRVLTKEPFKVIGPRRTLLSGCGGSSSSLDPAKLPKIPPGFQIGARALLSAMKTVLDSEIHRLTGGLHVVGLFTDEGLVARREDIGRHNAMDRVIGYGLGEATDFGHSFVVSSGRISSEMARKCLVAGIPVAVSRSATTTLAVELAERNGLTICGFARGGRMNVYSHPERITGVDQVPTGGSPAKE